jgi:hypothetical protein
MSCSAVLLLLAYQMFLVLNVNSVIKNLTGERKRMFLFIGK